MGLEDLRVLETKYMKNAGHSYQLLWQAHRTADAVANRFGPFGGVGFWWMIVMAIFCCRDKTLIAQSIRDETSKIIRRVRVEGNEVVSTSVILGKNKSRAGARFNEKLVDEDARRYSILTPSCPYSDVPQPRSSRPAATHSSGHPAP